MTLSDLFTFENFKLAITLSGWLLAVAIFTLSFIAPRTATTKDDEALVKLKWLRDNAFLAFSKVKFWHESGKIPVNTDRYEAYIKELEKAFESSWGQKLPERFLPEAKLIAEGLHSVAKLNPPPGPVSR